LELHQLHWLHFEFAVNCSHVADLVRRTPTNFLKQRGQPLPNILPRRSYRAGCVVKHAIRGLRGAMRLSQVLSPLLIFSMNMRQKREFSIRCVISSTASRWIQSRSQLCAGRAPICSVPTLDTSRSEECRGRDGAWGSPECRHGSGVWWGRARARPWIARIFPARWYPCWYDNLRPWCGWAGWPQAFDGESRWWRADRTVRQRRRRPDRTRPVAECRRQPYGVSRPDGEQWNFAASG